MKNRANGLEISVLVLSLSFLSMNTALADTSIEDPDPKPNQVANSAPLILGGQYLNTNNNMLPILFISFDTGTTWQYKMQKNIPQDFKTDGVILFSQCIGTNCVVGGAYSDAERKYPLMMVSNSQGMAWQYSIEKDKNLPAEYFSNGMFSRISCEDQHCASIGEYVTQDDKILPMLAVTLDAGKHWTYPVDSNNLPEPLIEGYFNSVHCKGSNCIAAGEYKINEAATDPMLISSHDAGKRWNYVINRNTSTPANYAKGGIFREAQCTTQNNCIAAGVYINQARKTMPMVALGGRKDQWTYPVDDHKEKLPADYFDNVFIYGMQCTGELCAVVGGYQDNDYNQYPLLLVSQDAGAQWTYQVDKSQNLPTDFKSMGSLNEISCSGKNCVAVGSYRAQDNLQYPLIIATTNGGKTWQYGVQKDFNAPPAPFHTSGSFSNVHCEGSRCAATGSYTNSNGAIFPMLAETYDGGKNWQYQVGGDLALPTNYKSIGGLFTVKCTKAVCYSGGRYITTDGKDYPMLVTSTQKNKPWTFIVDSRNPPADYATHGYFTNR